MPTRTNKMYCGKDENTFSKWMDGEMSMDTMAVHGGTAPDPMTGAILTPIYTSTAFIQPSVDDYLSYGYSYTRQDNPTVKALEKRIACLEGGSDAVCVASGMAATITVMSAFLKMGDHCVITECSYGGTNRCCRVHFAKYGIEFTYVDMRNPELVAKAIRPETRVIFSETPTNPIMQLCDIAAISKIAKAAGVLHICDSTFATPYISRPLELGADFVVQSTTKYYDGHNVSVGGAIIMADHKHYDAISLQRNIMGNIMTPQVAFHTLQTVKTLPIRVTRQSETAMKVAKFLSGHPKVESVMYPGLPDFPQRELAMKQHRNNLHGGMIAFEVKGGTETGRKLMDSVKRPWSLCENLGASESIITCPSVFTHANMLKEDRDRVGITDGLVRISCGLEAPEDLIASLEEALDKL